MTYIGIGDVPQSWMSSVMAIPGWDLEYSSLDRPDLDGYYAIKDVIFVRVEFSHPFTMPREPRYNVILCCGLPHYIHGTLPSGSDWHVKGQGLIRNFRSAWEPPTCVVGHWYDRAKAEKWMKGGISLPEGGMSEACWMMRTPMCGIIMDARDAVFEVSAGNRVDLI